ncbi:MAG: Crp/Fnr family transcriptional regulator [Bacillota bacterium]|nr:Crp/Fnr family transcriptional regulator [Bacillota bacterium]
MDDKKDKRGREDPDFLYHLLYLPRGIARLESLGTVKHVPANQELNKLDEIPECCYIVKSGRVICYEFTYEGEQRVYNFMEPNSLLMEECLLFDKPCPVLFKTAVDSELVCIDKCDLKRAFKRDIDVVMDVCESLATKFLSSMEQIRNVRQKNAEWKICKLLQIFGEQYGADYDGKVLIQEKISQQTLADMLGMNRVTVTRKFKELKDLSLLEQINGYYCIRSMEQLQDHMDHIENQ